MTGYVGRFAPSPTGALHAGSLVAALASWLDARAHDGRWLVRIEDADQARCIPEASTTILGQLSALGLQWDEPPQRQSKRSAGYQHALDRLAASAFAYPCACSRSDIALVHASAGRVSTPHHPLPYPGTCRLGLRGRPARAWRFACEKYAENRPQAHISIRPAASFSIANGNVFWHDRRLGPHAQNVVAEVGDFVLRRADDQWAYQLAVVVDDAEQGITHVVRGADLTDNTPRQILLQSALNLPTPQYLHTPLVLAPDGLKLSKQHGAPAIQVSGSEDALQALGAAARVLGLPAALGKASVSDALLHWVIAWRGLYNRARD